MTRRLQHQRHYQAVRSLQPPARNSAVPGGPLVAQGDQVPYPTPVEGKNQSDAIHGSLTHVFSPTMTNEIVFAYTYIGFPNVFEDPTKVDRATVGYNYKGIYNNGVSQIPSFGQSGRRSGAGLQSRRLRSRRNPRACTPTSRCRASATRSPRSWGTHTVKAGFF